MNEPWKEILIDVEPRGKEFRLGIDGDAVAGDIIEILIERCSEEGIDLKKWAKSQVGSEYQFVLLRKSEGNSILPPGMLLEDIEPEIETGERFKLSTQAVVGALPATILNRRVESLVDEFFNSSLADLYAREGWVVHDVEKKN